MTQSTACASGCGRPSPGATLCAACTGELRRTLELAASIEGDLDDATARLLRHGHGGGKRTDTESPLPVNLAASDAADQLRRALTACTGAVARAQRLMGAWSSIRVMAMWLRIHVADAAALPDAEIHAEAIRDAVARAVMVLEPPPELHPAGPCGQCGEPLYAEPAANVAECRRGHVTIGLIDARARRAAAADVLGTATEIAGALARLGIRVNAGTIRMWAARERLFARPGGKYAMSDVLALIAERDQRKVRA